MKVFAIRDELDKDNKNLAYLLYYENEKKFYIELPDDADLWETPLLLSSFLKRGEHTVNSYWSMMWVKQRIVPSDRQNLGQILKANGLEEYDEFSLLMLGNGRCAQDDYYLFPLTEEEVEKEFWERYQRRIEDVVPLKKGKLLVFFRNGKLKKVDVRKLCKDDIKFSAILNREDLFERVGIQTGGHGVFWSETYSISDDMLYKNGVDIPLTLEDFRKYISSRVVNTAEVVELLECSRQNVNDLVKRGKLVPVRKNQKNTLFLKSEVLQRKWN